MNSQLTNIRRLLLAFILALFLSGLSAIPVEQELKWLIKIFPFEGSIKGWLQEVLQSVQQTGKDYPFLFYGYDWLAFAHFVLAILFIGPYRNPVKNKWVVEFGIIACLLVIPFALIAGHFRGMPLWWRFVDCMFGITGTIVLVICLKKIKKLEEEEKEEAERNHLYDFTIA